MLYTVQSAFDGDLTSKFIVLAIRPARGGKWRTSKTPEAVALDVREGRSFPSRETADAEKSRLVGEQRARNDQHRRDWLSELQSHVCDETADDATPNLAGPVLDTDRFVVLTLAEYLKAAGLSA